MIDPDALPLGLLGHRCQRRAVVRQHDEGVGLLRDRLLDLLRLRVRVRGLEQLEVDVVVLVGGRLGVLRDRAEPTVVGRGNARDDRDRLAGAASAVVVVSAAVSVVEAESPSSSSPMQAVAPIARTRPARTEIKSRFRDIAYLLVC